MLNSSICLERLWGTIHCHKLVNNNWPLYRQSYFSGQQVQHTLTNSLRAQEHVCCLRDQQTHQGDMRLW